MSIALSPVHISESIIRFPVWPASPVSTTCQLHHLAQGWILVCDSPDNDFVWLHFSFHCSIIHIFKWTTTFTISILWLILTKSREWWQRKSIFAVFFLQTLNCFFPGNGSFHIWAPLSVCLVWFVLLCYSMGTVFFSWWKLGRSNKSHINKAPHRAWWGNVTNKDRVGMQKEAERQ